MYSLFFESIRSNHSIVCDAIIIPGTGMHNLELPLPAFMFRHVISSFGGSAGTFIIHRSGSASLWTDGRYELYVKTLSTSHGWDAIVKSSTDWQAQLTWIHETSMRQPLSERPVHIGVCGLQWSAHEYELLSQYAHALKYQIYDIPYTTLYRATLLFLEHKRDTVGLATIRKEIADATTSTTVWHFCEKNIPYNAKKTQEYVKTFLIKNEAHAFITSNAHEIAYITGLRSTCCIPHLMLVPCCMCCLYDTHKNELQYIFFLPKNIINTHTIQHLSVYMDVSPQSIEYYEYETLLHHPLEIIPKTTRVSYKNATTILYDSQNIPATIARGFVHASDTSHTIKTRSLETPFHIKDIRTDSEIQHIHRSIIEDSVAILEALADVVTRLDNEELLYEKSIADIILQYRNQREGFIQESFETISAAGAHGALPHYRPTTPYGARVYKNSPYLLDCGAHYACASHVGTTDMTRVFLFSQLCNTQNHHADVPYDILSYKRDYTAVLKSHIALSMHEFSPHSTGKQLDAIARTALATINNKAYNHGTGHGIGFCTDVHEGRYTISPRSKNIPFVENIILSNEPGYYVPAKWGIRLENMMCVRKSKTTSTLLAFETLTFFPFQTSLITTEMLSTSEKQWLTKYHERCNTLLSPRISDAARIVLKRLMA